MEETLQSMINHLALANKLSFNFRIFEYVMNEHTSEKGYKRTWFQVKLGEEKKRTNKRKREESPVSPKQPKRKIARKEIDKDHEVDKEYAKYHELDGHFLCKLGDSIGELLSAKEPERRRYKLIKKIGQGTFGRVFTCWDRVKECYVAIKVVRAVRKYTMCAKVEIDILNQIQNFGMNKENNVEKLKILNISEEASASSESAHETEINSLSKNHCIKLNSWFSYKGHICMVFDNCGDSLYDYLKKNDYRPFDVDVIKEVAFYLFQTLHFLHDQLHLIHTDLKPENILFEDIEEIGRTTEEKSEERESPDDCILSHNIPTTKTEFLVPSSTKIKVIDFGSAIFNKEKYHTSLISTRHYRAPEVILRLGWSYSADIWSVGCILLELHTGNTTFQTHNGVEHLAMMQKLLGTIPEELITETVEQNTEPKNYKIQKYFKENKRNFELEWPQRNSTPKAKRRVLNIPQLNDLIDEKKYPEFYDLVSKTLQYVPNKRITAKEALMHPFFEDLRQISQS